MTKEAEIITPEKQPVNNVIDENVLDDQLEMRIVRNMRVKINESLMDNGKIPEDPKALSLLMNNLRDMDYSAISRSRIKSEEKTANQAAATIGMVTNVLKTLRSNKVAAKNEPTKEAPTLPEELERKSFIQGETDIGVITEDIDSFKARMIKQNNEF